MPAASKRPSRAAYQRERRRRIKAAKSGQPVPPSATPIEEVDALAKWAREKLIVPPGHPAAGQPMEIPAFALDWLRDGWTAHESALSIARKNAKSAICAIVALGYLAGPLRRAGWRGAVCSLSKEKAAELRAQVVAIAKASGLHTDHGGIVDARKSPFPGSIYTPDCQFDTLSADRKAGHASGYDLVIIDETGLFPERARELLAGLRSSVSAKGGRIMHVSIRGDSPLYGEVLDNPATVTAVFAAPAGCALDDREAWRAANPGLGTIKSESYMAAEVRRIASAPGDEPAFRAFDLNLTLSPTRQMILSPDDLRKCFTDDPPPRAGPCLLGFDFGEATSGTAAVAVWPETGRVETWLAFGDKPDLKERGKVDNADYLSMEAMGELRTYPGRVVKPDQFLQDVAADLEGVPVEAAAADGYKDSEVKDFMDRAGLSWEIDFRRVGAGKDGGKDIRAFQRLVHTEKLAMRANLSLVDSISKSTLRQDTNGNPGLDKAHSRGRIDVLSAAVIAAGLAEPYFDRPASTGFQFVAIR